jgi:hypothetical protein
VQELNAKTHDISKNGTRTLFSNDQRGFQNGIEGCSHNLFILGELIKKLKKTPGQDTAALEQLYIIYIDYKNAFGATDHRVIAIFFFF